MKRILILLVLLELLLSQKIFQEGIISSENSREYGLTYIEDNWISFTTNIDNKKIIKFSYLIDGKWTKPEVAPFSGEFDDEYPKYNPQNQELYFASTRPVNGEAQSKNDLWFVKRNGKKWSEAKHISGKFSTKGIDSGGFRDGDDLYFHSDRNGGGFNGIEIFKLNLMKPDSEPIKLSINTDKVDGEAFLFNIGNAMIFMSAGYDSKGSSDIFFTRLDKNKQWIKPLNLEEINTKDWEYTPSLSLDLNYLYFTRLGRGTPSIYEIETSKIKVLKDYLESLNSKE